MAAEKTHKHLYDAHWQIMSARESMNKAMRLLGEAAEHHDDEFETLRASVSQQRSALDEVLRGLGNARSAVIKKTGCDGTCLGN